MFINLPSIAPITRGSHGSATDPLLQKPFAFCRARCVLCIGHVITLSPIRLIALIKRLVKLLYDPTVIPSVFSIIWKPYMEFENRQSPVATCTSTGKLP